MHEIKKCVHMDFNKSHGCTCSTDQENLNKIQYDKGYGEVYVVDVDTNIPAAEITDEKDKL